MAWFEPQRINERAVLRALVAGFALVLALLTLSGYVALRGTSAIEEDTADVGREQLVMARLINEAQAGQNTMAAILHRLARRQQSIAKRGELLRDLEAADAALTRLAASATQTPEAALWRELDRAVHEFSAGVRRALYQTGPGAAADLVPLLTLHDRLVRVEQQLLAASEKRIEARERAIESESRELAANARLLLGACLILGLLCAMLTVVFARRSIRKIEHQASELSRVSWHLVQGQESLARRFSHELHDELGQSLAAVKANLNAPANAPDWPSRRADCLEVVDSAIANVRELSQLLHPVILDDFGIDAGLRWLTEGFAQRTSIAAEYESTFQGRLNEDVETHLFRIAQEALTNVARHSRATRVQVELQETEKAGLRLTIEDNGIGIAAGPRDPVHASLGLTAMRARAREIGAAMRLCTPAGGGLRIEIDLPRIELAGDEESRMETNEQQPEKAHPSGG